MVRERLYPHLHILAMPFNFILSSYNLHFQTIHCFFMAMPLNHVNMILILYVIPIIIFSCDLNKLTILYICVHGSFHVKSTSFQKSARVTIVFKIWPF